MFQRPQEGTKSKYPGAGGLRCLCVSYPSYPVGCEAFSGKWEGAGREHGFPRMLLLPSSLEPSPYEESEVHDSFHQLIQEQSLRVAEEGLELLSLGPGEPRLAL